MSTLTPTPHGDPVFLSNAQVVVRGVRRALAELLGSVNADPAEPQEISRRFGLDKTLTWKTARVVREPDPSDAVAHIPRRPSLQLLVTALQRHGAPADKVSALWSAVDAFEDFVETHTDDRETLEIMVGSSRANAGMKRLEAFRKSAFQANSAIWGVRAKFQVSMHAVSPAAGAGDQLVINTIAGFHEFKRLRSDVPWAVATAVRWGSTNDASKEVVEPIDPEVRPGDAPLLKQFCSAPLPRMRSVDLPEDRVRYEMTEGPVGNTAAATVLMGWTRRGGVSKYESYAGERGEHGVFLTTPVEAVVHDLLVHRSLEVAFSPTGSLYSELPGGPRYTTDGTAAGRIPFGESVLDLGMGPPDLTTPEFPHYRELAEKLVARSGFPLDEYRGYRLRLAYPPIPTLAVLGHALLTRGS